MNKQPLFYMNIYKNKIGGENGNDTISIYSFPTWKRWGRC